jgi:hypothetical protein
MKWLATLVLFGVPLAGFAAEPCTLLDGCRLELLAREPDIVTPIGVAFDRRGRLLVVESHTHQRPEDYTGPLGDRLRMFDDSDGDGRLDHWSTFAEGFHHAMNVAVRPDGGVYLVARGEVHLLRDTDGDGAADDDQLLLRMETEVDYPHNALSGIALVGDQMYLGLGENFGDDYRLFGSDGTMFDDSGGAGTLFVCQADGSQLRRYATGFWNPFSLCLAGRRLFCVDNDPDASPTCRLIDVAEHGDYGFRFEYGRAGVHPLQAWNGELPGTMPMICGTGEAPTAVVFHRGYLWVTSWGDHRIERYQLTPNETGSYTAQMEVVVQGDADFRPTGMAVAPDGSLFFADWVDRSYPVHGKGRLWRLQLPKDMQCDLAPHQESPEVAEDSELTRLERLRWERTVAGEELIDLLREALQSPDDDVRLFAVRWIAEVRVLELADDLDKLLDAPPPSERYYLAVLGAIDWLNREPEQRHSGIADGLLARELRNSERSAESQALALRLMSPDYEFLTLERLRGYLQSDYKPLRLEAIRTLALREDGQRFALLADVLQNESQSDAVRAEALVGLAAAPTQYGPLIEQFAKGDNPVLRREAERTIRFVGPSPETEEKPSADDLTAWVDLLAEPGDAASGRRLFFSPVGPRCAACHRYGGRGGLIGPDLSQIAQQSSRARTIASILDPSAEIAPHYQAWLLQTDDGKTHVGLRLPTGGDDGQEPYADPTGRTFVLPSETIELRQPSAASIMPAGLEKSLTIAELRDLVTFLMQAP